MARGMALWRGGARGRGPWVGIRVLRGICERKIEFKGKFKCVKGACTSYGGTIHGQELTIIKNKGPCFTSSQPWSRRWF